MKYTDENGLVDETPCSGCGCPQPGYLCDSVEQTQEDIKRKVFNDTVSLNNALAEIKESVLLVDGDMESMLLHLEHMNDCRERMAKEAAKLI